MEVGDVRTEIDCHYGNDADDERPHEIATRVDHFAGDEGDVVPAVVGEKRAEHGRAQSRGGEVLRHVPVERGGALVEDGAQDEKREARQLEEREQILQARPGARQRS